MTISSSTVWYTLLPLKVTAIKNFDSCVIILSHVMSILKYIFWCLGIKRHCHLFYSSSKCLRKEKRKYSHLLMQHRQGFTKEDLIVFKPRSDLISNDQQWRCFMLKSHGCCSYKARHKIETMRIHHNHCSLKVSWIPFLNLNFRRVWLYEKYNYRKHTNTSNYLVFLKS